MMPLAEKIVGGAARYIHRVGGSQSESQTVNWADGVTRHTPERVEEQVSGHVIMNRDEVMFTDFTAISGQPDRARAEVAGTSGAIVALATIATGSWTNTIKHWVNRDKRDKPETWTNKGFHD